MGCICWCCLGQLPAQELLCRIQVNSSKIQGTDKSVFTALEESLNEYVNNRKWSEAQIAVSEKIDCSMVITVNEMTDNHFKCDLQVQSRRPVFNASYVTPLFNFRDKNFEFNYQEYEPLVYNENTIESNLTAVIDFYAYIILGLDFDSFSPKGGTPFFQRAEQIVNIGQSSMESGWKAFEDTRNRHALLTALTEQRTDMFRTLWYNYHRKGLDEMALSVDKGRAAVTEAVKMIDEVYEANSTSVLLPVFSDAKLDELVNIYSLAPQSEKEEMYKLLSRIYPTESNRLQEIRKENR